VRTHTNTHTSLGWTAVHNLYFGQCTKFCDEYLHAFMLSLSRSGIFVSTFQGSKLYATLPRASFALGGLRSPLAGFVRPWRASFALGGLRSPLAGFVRPWRASLALGWHVAPRWGFCSSVDADVGGRWCKGTCLTLASTDPQPGQMHHAYSHILLLCRHLTMLNPRLQPGGRHTPKLVPSRGTTGTSTSTITAPNLSFYHKISHNNKKQEVGG